MTILGHAIMDTLTYHDLFDFPLTAQEVRLTLAKEREVSQQVIFLELASLQQEGRVDSLDGLWHLSGKSETVTHRKKRYMIAEKKFRIAKRFFQVAKYVPFLRAVYICNTLSRSNAREGSDIDLFIVTASNRIWITRLFVTGFAKLLAVRPNRKTSKDKLCLSFFNTEDALDLRTHAIENDVYLPHWLLDLYPIYDEAGISGKIFAENAWARTHLSGLRRQIGSSRRVVSSGKGVFKDSLEGLCSPDVLEQAAKAIQLRIMPDKLKKSAREGNGVVINDKTLKLHGLDRRAEIRDRYENAVSAHAETRYEDYARTA